MWIFILRWILSFGLPAWWLQNYRERLGGLRVSLNKESRLYCSYHLFYVILYFWHIWFRIIDLIWMVE